MPSLPETRHRTRKLVLPVLATLALIAFSSPATATQAPPLCTAPPPDPAPSGPFGRTNEPFPSADHNFLTSSTHLQGVRAQVKWAGGLLQLPPAVPDFAGFTSAVVVDNPDTIQAVAFHIDYFDHLGTLVGTSTPAPIPPEGFYVEAATPLQATSGVGSARIVVDDGPGILGATLLHTTCVFNVAGTVCDLDRPLSLNGQRPGASSMQQLQETQEKTELWWGPLTLSNTGASDFFNGEAPFLWVVNPNPVPNTVRVDLVAFDRTSGTVTSSTWRTVTLNPFGTLFEKSGAHLAGTGLWDFFMGFYTGGVVPDRDYLVHVVSQDGLPILGDGVMTDIFGDGFPNNLVPGQRFRMASTMLANTPSHRLVNPDLSYQPGGIIQTLMGVFNVGTTDAGPLTIEYFDPNGFLLSTWTVPSLPPNHSLRIHPGVLGYPPVTVGFGWVRITACQDTDELVGWSVREILDVGARQWHKAYGDTLLELDGAEPGPGFNVVALDGTPWIRRVMPLVRVTPSFPWPGYTTFVNDHATNINPYRWQFWSSPGGFCGQANFPGLPWGFTSWTYEDPLVTCSGNLSGRVDHTNGMIDGIDVLGDPFDEYNIPGFAVDLGPVVVPVE